MDQNLKTKWITALRSGDYKQGTCSLKNPNGRFCALGVLCDLDPRVEWIVRFGQPYAQFEGNADPYKLPEAYRHEIGLDEGPMQDITDLNDGSNSLPKRSFERIADWIEDYL